MVYALARHTCMCLQVYVWLPSRESGIDFNLFIWTFLCGPKQNSEESASNFFEMALFTTYMFPQEFVANHGQEETSDMQ